MTDTVSPTVATRYRGGESAIEATQSQRAAGFRQPARAARAVTASAVILTFGLVFFSFLVSAFAGQSSTGELAFLPCTRCHPVVVGADGKPTKPLPNGFEKHEIELEVHDILGAGDKACLACHDDPAKNPGMLLLADGTLVDITGEVSRVCQRCHFEKYREWEVGVHGKREPKCSASGCHDPHTPSWIYIAALPPFQGTGIEARAVGDREPFKPMASPPVPPHVETPMWLTIATSIGAIVSLGALSYLTLGRRKR